MENKKENIDQLFLESRVIWLNSQVNDESMYDVVSKVLYMSAIDPTEDIYLIINSPGGSITSGMMLIDVINSIPNDVVTIGMGMCASMGQLFVTSGTSGKRYILKNGRVMMHQPSGGFGGDIDDIKISMELINDMKVGLAAITAAKTGQTPQKIREDGERDAWFNAEEAKEYGFIDHIIENIFDLIPMPTAAIKVKENQERKAKLEQLQIEKIQKDISEASDNRTGDTK